MFMAVALVVTGHLFVAQPTAACSCVPQDMVLESAGEDPGSSVFTAEAGNAVAAALPVRITRWFKGIPPAEPTFLEMLPGDGANCGLTNGPPPAQEYLFVTYASDTSRLAISLCSVVADVQTPEGVALLTRAAEIFGPGLAPPSADPAPSPAPVGDGVAMLIPGVLALVFGLGLLVGILAVVRRLPTGSGRGG